MSSWCRPAHCQSLLQPLPCPQPHCQFAGRMLCCAVHVLQNIGPRHAFAVSKGVEAKLRVPGGACSSSRIRQQGGAWSWDLSLLVRGEDVDFVEALGGSVNEYDGFRTSFEEEYTTKLSIAAGEMGGIQAHAHGQCVARALRHCCPALWLGCDLPSACVQLVLVVCNCYGGFGLPHVKLRAQPFLLSSKLPTGAVAVQRDSRAAAVVVPVLFARAAAQPRSSRMS